MDLTFFITTIYPSCILVTGIVANTLVILTYSRPKFSKLPTRSLWILLAIVEILCITQIIKHFIPAVKHLKNTSRLACKLFSYTSHSGSINAWLLVYISIDRLLAIIYPRLGRLAQKHKKAILAILIIANLVLYSQRLVYDDILIKNSTNSTSSTITYCTIAVQYMTPWEVLAWFDLFNSTLFPFFFMLVSSLYLTYSILISRRRLLTKTSSTANRRLNKDIRFSITLIAINVVFVVLNLPITIYFIIEILEITIVFYILDYMYYTSYCVNFFIYLAVNVNFRQEFLRMIRLAKPPDQNKDKNSRETKRRYIAAPSSF